MTSPTNSPPCDSSGNSNNETSQLRLPQNVSIENSPQVIAEAMISLRESQRPGTIPSSMSYLPTPPSSLSSTFNTEWTWMNRKEQVISLLDNVIAIVESDIEMWCDQEGDDSASSEDGTSQ